MPRAAQTPAPQAADTAKAWMLSVLVLCLGGCASTPAAPPPIAIVIGENGTLTVDGQAADSAEHLSVLVKQKADERGSSACPTPSASGAVPPQQRPREATIHLTSPEKSTYEDLQHVLLACGRAALADLALEGIAFSLPKVPVCVIRGTTEPPAEPAFFPLEVRSPDDLKVLREGNRVLEGHGAYVQANLDTPLSLVLEAAKAIHEAGGQIGFRVSLEQASDTQQAPIVLVYAELEPTGVIRFKVTLRPGAEIPESDVLATLKASDESPFKGRTFFGIPLGDGAKKVVYVSDRSGSMTDSMDYVKFELRRSIGELDEGDQFHVLFFSSGAPVEMPTRRLANATRRIKALAWEFIDGIVPQGETDPSKALERAFAVRPDVIYLLTDGEFDRSVVDLVKQLNPDKRVKVNAISFLYGPHVVLKEIAKQSGGTYRFLSEADLASMLP